MSIAPLNVATFGRAFQNTVYTRHIVHHPTDNSVNKDLLIELQGQTSATDLKLYAQTDHGIDIRGGSRGMDFQSVGAFNVNATGALSLSSTGTFTIDSKNALDFSADNFGLTGSSSLELIGSSVGITATSMTESLGSLETTVSGSVTEDFASYNLDVSGDATMVADNYDLKGTSTLDLITPGAYSLDANTLTENVTGAVDVNYLGSVTMDVEGSITQVATGNIDITTSGTYDVSATGTMTLDATDVDIHGTTSLDLTAGTDLTMTSTNLTETISGNLSSTVSGTVTEDYVTYNLDVSGDATMVADNYDLKGTTTLDLITPGDYSLDANTLTENVTGAVDVNYLGSVTMDVEGSITQVATGNIDITTSGTYDLSATGTMTLDATDVDIHGTTSLDLTAGTDLTMTSTNLTETISGNLNSTVSGTVTEDYVTYNLDVSGDATMVADNYDLKGTTTLDLITPGDYSLDVGGNVTEVVTGSVDVTVTGSYDLSSTGTMTLDATDVDIHGTTSLDLTAGTDLTMTSTNLTETISGNLNSTVSGTVTEDYVTYNLDVSGSATMVADNYDVKGTTTLDLITPGDYSLDVGGNVTEVVTGNVTLTTTGTYTSNSTGDMTLGSTNEIVLNAGTLDINSSGAINIDSTGGNIIIGETNDGTITIGASGAGTLLLQGATVTIVSGTGGGSSTFEDLVINGELTVNGTATYINTSNTLVEDKNIQLAATDGVTITDISNAADAEFITLNPHSFDVSDYVLLQGLDTVVNGLRQITDRGESTFTVNFDTITNGGSGTDLNGNGSKVDAEATVSGAGFDILAHEAGSLRTRYLRFDNTGNEFQVGVSDGASDNVEAMNMNLVNSGAAYEVAGTELLKSNVLQNMTSGIYMDGASDATTNNFWRMTVLNSGASNAQFVIQQYETGTGWVTRFSVENV